MINTDLIEELNVGKVLEDVSMLEYTTYKVDGKIRCVVYPKDINSLILLINYLKDNDIKHMVLGNGSNVIFKDGKYDGVIIKLDDFDNMDIDGDLVTVGAGYSLMKLSIKLTKLGLSGLEFATGIPGSVGGAVYMNAGAYNSEMSNIINTVKILRDDKVLILDNADMEFSYRTNILHGTDDIVLQTTLKLVYGDVDKMIELINNRKKRRLESQPIDMPSCGSVFRNPDDNSAWKLIDECGLKGYKIGGAEISSKHANFIVNSGDATSNEIIKLIDLTKKSVKDKFNIDLKTEQEIIE